MPVVIRITNLLGEYVPGYNFQVVVGRQALLSCGHYATISMRSLLRYGDPYPCPKCGANS